MVETFEKNEKNGKNEKFRMEKVAPEGGWGYLVGLGLTFPFVSIHFDKNT